MKGWIFVLLLFLLVVGAGCSVLKEDRCWVDDYQYLQAKKIYETTRNLDLVRRNLEGQHTWRNCEINEVIYRIKKEYHLEDETIK